MTVRPGLLGAARVVALLILGSSAAHAGAWQKPKGEGFSSAAVRLTWPQDITRLDPASPEGQYYTLYLEYGLTERLTGGLDLGRSVSGATKAIAFLQLPVRDRDTGPKISAALGLGQIDGDAVLRPGLSVGWGLENGWLSADGFAEIHLGGSQTDFKLDITWGRNLPRDRKVLLQIQTGAVAGEPSFIRLAPSMVFPLRDQLRIETGISLGLVGDDSVGILFGIWNAF